MIANGDTHGRILVVDDEEDIALFLKKALEDHGFEAVTYSDPLLALSNFRKGSFDLVLVDIKMPTMDGFALYQQLQTIDSEVKICLMTAFEVYYDALKEIFPDSYESICFIKKPFSVNDFVKKINAEMGGSDHKTVIE